MRQLGSSHIDYRLRETDFSDQQHMPLFPGLDISLAEIEASDVIVLIGSHIQKEQPIAGLRVRQAVQKGARVIAINMMDYDFNFTVSAKKITAPHQFVQTLADIAKSLSEPNEEYQAFTQLLREGKKVCVLTGIQGFHHPQAADTFVRWHTSWQRNVRNLRIFDRRCQYGGCMDCGCRSSSCCGF